MSAPLIVATELVTRDRDSFDWWWPQHLTEILAAADRLYLRVDPATWSAVTTLLAKHHLDLVRDRSIICEKQSLEFGRWQEDYERDQLLRWAENVAADWTLVFDADEVIEPGGGQALRALLHTDPGWRVFGVQLTYSSHHRPGYVLPRGEYQPWRGFRIDDTARRFSFRADEDGLHCGSVPHPRRGSVFLPDIRVVHYHATTPAEYMAERAFYADTTHVEKWGGIDWLYRCDRFGDEQQAVPLEEDLAGAAERLERLRGSR